jgi:hypothetical protein
MLRARFGVVVELVTVVVIPGILDVALKVVTVPVPDSKPARSSIETLYVAVSFGSDGNLDIISKSLATGVVLG